MKIRNGFVSNSSSTSFLLYGVELDLYDVIDMMENNKSFVVDGLFKKLYRCDLSSEFGKKAYINIKKQIDELNEGYSVSEVLDSDVLDLLEENCSRSIDVILRMEIDTVYIGASPVLMEKEERKIDWMNKVEKEIKELGIDTNERPLGWMEDCFMT